MFNEQTLSGKRILVTGGGTGLGKEISRAMVASGADVYICGRREGVLQETCAELGKEGPGAIHYRVCDIRSPESIDEMVASIFEEGPLTGLVNNAAANFIAPTKDLSPRGYEAIRSTVMDGAFFTTLAIGKRWIKLGIPGSIVSNLVTWVWTGSAYVVPSAMSKTAIDSMTKSLAVEWGQYNIRVNAVAPGPFPTEGAWDKLNPTGKSSGATDSASVPMRRYGEMHELANLMIFLQADGCAYLTGQTIAIDGGHHLASPSTFASLSDLSDEEWQNIKTSIKASAEKEKSQRNIG